MRLAPANTDRPHDLATCLAASAAPPPRRITLVSSRLFREGLMHALAGVDTVLTEGWQTVDETLAGMDGCCQPDLIIVVACSAGGIDDALSQIEAARGRLPDIKWLLLGDSLSPERLRQAVDCGVAGILLHDISGQVLKCAAELVMMGQTILPHGLIDIIAAPPAASCVALAPARGLRDRGMAEERQGVAADVWPADAAAPVHLSERERQILDCLVKGYSNKLIARQLEIADATVKVHVKALLRKMQVANRTQAAIRALNYTTPRPPDATVVELPPAHLHSGGIGGRVVAFAG